MDSDPLFDFHSHPYGRSWKKWAEIWCLWLYSIPKHRNPGLDATGKYSRMNQYDDNAWFLAGTFGNTILVRRNSTIPRGKGIFFPILVKEDSFADDSDLTTESQLMTRCENATDKVLSLEAIVDGKPIENIERYRVQSDVFDLDLPDDNVYGIEAGSTRAVCDGFWLFLKPMSKGRHEIYFKGETRLAEQYTSSFMNRTDVYRHIKERIHRTSTFRVEVLYDLIIAT